MTFISMTAFGRQADCVIDVSKDYSVQRLIGSRQYLSLVLQKDRQLKFPSFSVGIRASI